MITSEAIVLAGGLGTRLKDILPGIPKCMAPVNGKPFLTYILDHLIHQKINKVILSVAFRKDHIINYLGYKYHSLDIAYSIESEPLGTGGAIKLALEYCRQNEVFVMNGDTFFPVNLHALEEIHFHNSADITLAVKNLSQTGRFGLIEYNPDGRITDFREKQQSSGNGWINGGIYLINRTIFKNVNARKFSIENDVFRTSCSELKIMAFPTDAFFLDIGVPEDYFKAQSLLKNLETK